MAIELDHNFEERIRKSWGNPRAVGDVVVALRRNLGFYGEFDNPSIPGKIRRIINRAKDKGANECIRRLKDWATKLSEQERPDSDTLEEDQFLINSPRES